MVDLKCYEYDFAYFLLRLMSYFFCFNVDNLSMGFGHRNCVSIGCPNSGQRLGKWAAIACELHGCNNGSSMCDCQPPFKLFPFNQTVNLLTGIPLKPAFHKLFDCVKGSIKKVRYWSGPKKTSRKGRNFRKSPKKFGPKRSLLKRTSFF